MNKKEFSIFCMALRTYYPRENILPNEQAMELWYRELQDLPYNLIEAGLRKWVNLNQWSPSIANIRMMCTEIAGNTVMDWGEGWEQVLRGIRKYGHYNEREALEEMDDITRATVKRLGFKSICMSENITADRANFRMVYEQLAKRREEDKSIPLELKKQIDEIKGNNLFITLK